MTNNKRYCSFCGKDSDMVKVLIAGPRVFICDECVALCTKIIEGRETPQNPEYRFNHLSEEPIG